MPSKKEINDAIRKAVNEAVIVESVKPFNLSGRGHEPRVTLSSSLAAILRKEMIPCVVTSGFGASKHYPLRVFETAAKNLEKRCGETILRRHGIGLRSAYKVVKIGTRVLPQSGRLGRAI